MQTVLLIDDNPQIRACLAGVIRVFGYRVLTAEDGDAGLRALERRRPDVVISDVEMPGLDGFGFLQKVRANPEWAGLPVLLLSQMTDPDGRQLAVDLGADDYLAKPIAPWELVEAIRRHLSPPSRRSSLGAEVGELATCNLY